MVLNKPDTAMPVWGRVAGDAMDAAVLATGLGYGNRQRGGAAAAMLFVLVAGGARRRRRRLAEPARTDRAADRPPDPGAAGRRPHLNARAARGL